MNSGRDIIDNLLELSDNSKGNVDGADVPKCPGHGYPCIKKTVKKSGKNKGREFYVCPLDRKQQCRCFFWADDSVAFAMQEFKGNFTKEELTAKRFEAEKRKILQLTVKELKLRLMRRNLSHKGKKDELIDRLAKSISDAPSSSKMTPADVVSSSSSSDYSSGDTSGAESDESLEVVDELSSSLDPIPPIPLRKEIPKFYRSFRST